jgi:TonB family protein
MNTRSRLVLSATLALGLSRPLSGADTSANTGTGYTVLLELKINEQGTVEDATVAGSEDTSPDHILDQISMEKAHDMKLPPRLKDGRPVKYTVKAPFVYAIEGDEPAANLNLVRPAIRQAAQPVYPADLAAKGEVGGAILEVVIGADGKVKTLTVLRSTHPGFAAAATAAVKQWSFTPAVQDGVAVDSRWRLSVSFATDVRLPSWKWRFAPRPSLGNYTVVHMTAPPKPAATDLKPALPPAGK